MDITVTLLALAAIGSWLFRTSMAFRIALSVIFVFILILRYKPVVCYFVFTMAVGFYLLYYGFDALRKGTIDIRSYTRFSTYDRRSNPVEFWLYISLFGILGALALASSIYFSFN